MALAGIDPAVAAERAGHTGWRRAIPAQVSTSDEAEIRPQALRLEALVRAHLDTSRTEDLDEADSPLNEADADDGRTWDRTRDLPRVKRALSR
jgi:hypothetical protein